MRVQLEKRGVLGAGQVKKGGSLPRHIPILNIYLSTPGECIYFNRQVIYEYTQRSLYFLLILLKVYLFPALIFCTPSSVMAKMYPCKHPYKRSTGIKKYDNPYVRKSSDETTIMGETCFKSPKLELIFLLYYENL